MKSPRLPISAYVVLFSFLVIYFCWLQKAYLDVVWMDQMQWIAGNVNHFLNNQETIQDFYYLTPYIQSFSILWAVINSKLFFYNTYIDNILSGLVLFLIARYYIKSSISLFDKKKLIFFFTVCLIIFGLHKWEASLNGMGLGFFLSLFSALTAMNLAHKYYLNQLQSTKYFSIAYLLLCGFLIMEYGPYYVAFQISMLISLLINYAVLKKEIDIIKWRRCLMLNFLLILLTITINISLNKYATTHPYTGYFKVVASQQIGEFFEKLIHNPVFIFKFFFSANTGNLLDNESYSQQSTGNFIIALGMIVVSLYALCIVRFIKRKQSKYIFQINLILFTLVFLALVTIVRSAFNDPFYGTSSRYSVITCTGILALTTILLSEADFSKAQFAFRKNGQYLLPYLGICICYFFTDFSQWKIAPYRKKNYEQMIESLKLNINLEKTQANTIELASKARKVMIENKLNVFKPITKIETNVINNSSLGSDIKYSGFYDLEGTEKNNKWRWTNGEGIIFLPNYFSESDSFKLSLACYLPQPDTPLVVINDDIYPSSIRKLNDGYEYKYVACKQKVFFLAKLINKSYSPAQKDSTSTDTRKLGLVFKSLTISN